MRRPSVATQSASCTPLNRSSRVIGSFAPKFTLFAFVKDSGAESGQHAAAHEARGARISMHLGAAASGTAAGAHRIFKGSEEHAKGFAGCLLYTSPSPRD